MAFFCCDLICLQRGHVRQAIENGDLLVTDVHDGCGRAKLQDVVLLTDRGTLKVRSGVCRATVDLPCFQTVLEFKRST